MACFGIRFNNTDGTPINIRRAKPWKHSKPITMAKLYEMREEFWDTAPQAGGDKEIWDALHKAADELLARREVELSHVQGIVDAAGIIVQNSDLTVCHDDRGFRYELPKYVLRDPKNLVPDRRIDDCIQMARLPRRRPLRLVWLIYVLPLLMCLVYLIYGYK